MLYSSINQNLSEAIKDVKRGLPCIIVDDESRENEGDLVLAADYVTPESINFMMKFARGVICLVITEEKAKRVQLTQIEKVNAGKNSANFLVPVDASMKHNVSTGVSSFDRAKTIQVINSPDASIEDITVPGHVSALICKNGGLKEREGHTEASMALVSDLAGCSKCAVICEIVNDDGTMARANDLSLFAEKHNIKIITIQEIIQEIKRKEEIR